jgi:sulfopyruvate decarboxylase subunit beta
MTTAQAIAEVLPLLDGHAVICANGYISRWACACADRPAHFYMIGSMGLASSIALGIARVRPQVPVAVLDGDGNVLMNLGSLASIGVAAPARFRHVVFDNGVYASTGNQPTISSRVALEAVAAATGYTRTARVRSPMEVRTGLAEQLAAPGPSFLLVETMPDPQGAPPAPRIPFTPPEMTARMRRALDGIGAGRAPTGSR